MSRYIYLNGKVLPEHEARISPMDRGLLYGDGLFETMRVYSGTVHLLRRHLERLRRSAKELRIHVPGDKALKDAIYAVLHANDMVNARLRLKVTRGEGGTPTDSLEDHEPTVMITVRELPAQRGLSSGENIIVLSQPLHPPYTSRRLKTLNYLQTVHAGFELQEAGVREGLMLTPEGMVAEGTVSNFFCVKEGTLFTPSLEAGILPGITRERMLELAGRQGIIIREELFGQQFLMDSDECFYTNSIREIIPVTSTNTVPIGNGVPGPITVGLYGAYTSEVPNEDG